MKLRIEQLVEEGFTEADATVLAKAELERAKALITEGFVDLEKITARAQNDVAVGYLVALKVKAGLSKEQAEAVANEQISTNARVLAENLKSKDTATREEAKQKMKQNAAVRAEFLTLLQPKMEAAPAS